MLGFAQRPSATRCAGRVEAWARRAAPGIRAGTRDKLVQLTAGVPDVYQGTESVAVALVDPDNRGPVDVAALTEALARLDAGEGPRDLGEEKLLVTSLALRLRARHPEAFTGPAAGFQPLPSSSGTRWSSRAPSRTARWPSRSRPPGALHGTPGGWVPTRSP